MRSTTSTSKLMRYYGPHLLSGPYCFHPFGQLERNIILIAKRALGAWNLCVSDSRKRLRASERNISRARARERERARESKTFINLSFQLAQKAFCSMENNQNARQRLSSPGSDPGPACE